ncbi:MAG TPA: hypothetical protein DD429_07025 [Clostridiaceae bacterium]|nr:hypothetical protein [Clostridiaceae bacterium]
MYNLFLAVNASKMNAPFSAESFDTFMKGLKITGLGMTTVIGVLFLIYLIIKLLIKIFPENK